MVFTQAQLSKYGSFSVRIDKYIDSCLSIGGQTDDNKEVDMLTSCLPTLFAKYAPLITKAVIPDFETPKILLTLYTER